MSYIFDIKRTHVSTFLVSCRSRSPHVIGEIIQLLGGAGLLVAAWGEVGIRIAALVQLSGSVAIFWSEGSDCHGFGLYPHHDRLSLKLSNLFSEVLVGLMTCTDSNAIV